MHNISTIFIIYLYIYQVYSATYYLVVTLGIPTWLGIHEVISLKRNKSVLNKKVQQCSNYSKIKTIVKDIFVDLPT